MKNILQVSIRITILTSSGQTIVAPEFPALEGLDLKC
jgi:hypothetical protein